MAMNDDYRRGYEDAKMIYEDPTHSLWMRVLVLVVVIGVVISIVSGFSCKARYEASPSAKTGESK